MLADLQGDVGGEVEDAALPAERDGHGQGEGVHHQPAPAAGAEVAEGLILRALVEDFLDGLHVGDDALPDDGAQRQVRGVEAVFGQRALERLLAGQPCGQCREVLAGVDSERPAVGRLPAPRFDGLFAEDKKLCPRLV
jgi:hypothetical protein